MYRGSVPSLLARPSMFIYLANTSPHLSLSCLSCLLEAAAPSIASRPHFSNQHAMERTEAGRDPGQLAGCTMLGAPPNHSAPLGSRMLGRTSLLPRGSGRSAPPPVSVGGGAAAHPLTPPPCPHMNGKFQYKALFCELGGLCTGRPRASFSRPLPEHVCDAPSLPDSQLLT